METFEWILLLLVGAVGLTAIARRIHVPYPSLLALGGAGLALLPSAPRFELDPELTLALFVAPVLLDAAYDTSVRDLRANWIEGLNTMRCAPASSLHNGMHCWTCARKARSATPFHQIEAQLDVAELNAQEADAG